MKVNQITIFGLIYCLGACISINIGSCKPASDQQSSSQENEISQPGDTVKRNQITQVINDMNAQLGLENYYRIPFPIKHAEDSLEYWVINNEPARMSLRLHPTAELEEWPTFFVKDGKLILVRLRTWFKTSPTPGARESMVYLQDEKIFYCDERSMDLPEGIVPAYLREKPMTMSTRPFSEIENEYSAYWEKVKGFMIEQKKTLNKSN